MTDPDAAIDRSSPIPFYFQLAAILEHEIIGGRWQPGQQLPSEPSIAEQYELSRSTVRQALARLEQGGLVVRRKGEGTFVDRGHPRTWLLQSSEGFFQEELLRAGSRVTSRVLAKKRVTLPNWACDLLSLPPDSPGVMLERVRAIDGLVAMYVVNHLPENLADAVLEMDDPDASLYQQLSETPGLRVAGGSRTLEAVTAGEQLASLLEVAPSSAVAFIESVSWDREQTPFDCYRAWVRTDRMKIDIEVSAVAAPTTTADAPGLGAARTAPSHVH